MHKLSTKLIFIRELKSKIFPENQWCKQPSKSYSHYGFLFNSACE